MPHAGLKFGIFMAPFHRLGDNPTLAIHRDLELIEHLDRSAGRYDAVIFVTALYAPTAMGIRHWGRRSILVPPLAALIGWVVLGREVAPLAWLGTAIAALGVVLARRGAAKPGPR